MTTSSLSAAAGRDPGLEAAADLLDVSNRLTALLGQETALLTAMRVREIEALQPEKLRLARLYQKATAALRRDDVSRPALPGPLKARLLAAAQRLTEAAAENERSLRVSRTATERLIGAVIAAVKEQRLSTGGYTARMAAPRSAAVSGVALDRRL